MRRSGNMAATLSGGDVICMTIEGRRNKSARGTLSPRQNWLVKRGITLKFKAWWLERKLVSQNVVHLQSIRIHAARARRRLNRQPVNRAEARSSALGGSGTADCVTSMLAMPKLLSPGSR